MAGNASRHGLNGMACKSADELLQLIFLYTKSASAEKTSSAIRNIGNLAAHPNKYVHTGEIVNVEPGEAEWLLDVLEELFDITFVQPKITQAKKDKLNQKLSALGHKHMK
jgi:hypothetical protein